QRQHRRRPLEDCARRAGEGITVTPTIKAATSGLCRFFKDRPMPAQLIDGNALASKIRAEVAERARALAARGHKPGLAVILVGDDPASQVYVKHKVADCEASGVRSVLERYDASLPEAELLARIDALNADPTIHGILVQMPLPKHIAP